MNYGEKSKKQPIIIIEDSKDSNTKQDREENIYCKTCQQHKWFESPCSGCLLGDL